MLLPICSFDHFGWLLISLFFCPKLYCISRFAHCWPIRPGPLRLNRRVWPAFCACGQSLQELVFVCLRGFLSLGRRFEQDFISEICICYDQALFWIHTGLVPAKNHFQPRLFSSQPAFPAWSVIQEITFSMREGKPFWNGRAPGKGCFQPRAYSRPELFPALYSFQPYPDHPVSTMKTTSLVVGY